MYQMAGYREAALSGRYGNNLLSHCRFRQPGAPDRFRLPEFGKTQMLTVIGVKQEVVSFLLWIYLHHTTNLG